VNIYYYDTYNANPIRIFASLLALREQNLKIILTKSLIVNYDANSLDVLEGQKIFVYVY